MDIVIDYQPNKKQAQFHMSSATEAVYGGAKGGGKSCALIMEAMTYALEHPGAVLYLFRETYPDLEDTLIPEWESKVPRDLFKWNGKSVEARMINGSIVKFRYVRNWDDANKYQGRSMDFIGVDELTKHEERTVQELMSCLRSPKGYPVRFRGTCNPGGIGHHWVKKKYVTGTKYGEYSYEDTATGNKVEFIPATVYDNDILMKNDPQYVKRLENLPYEQKRAFLYGDWDVFEGMALDNWNESLVVVEDFEIPNHWRRWIAVDNGYTDPFAWYWLAVDEEGTVYFYREYTRDYEDEKVIYRKQAEKVVELSRYEDPDKYRELIENNIMYEDADFDTVEYENIDFIVVGHDAWQHHPSTRNIDTPQGKSILDYYEEGGLMKLGGVVKPLTDRKLRKATWIEYLEPFEDQEGNMTTKVKIFRSCKKLIETLPLLVNDKNDPEKVQDGEIDHWYDASGYGLIAYHTSKSAPAKKPRNRIEEHKQRLAQKNKMSKRRMM
jgi:hypothetical protein